MKKVIYGTLLLMWSALTLSAQSDRVYVQQDAGGMALMVNEQKFMVNGMNWDHFPIGTNYSYSLWNQPEEVIKAVLEKEMSMLRSIGVNAIRVYTGVPPKWIQHIYENYGIYTMLNHSFGRYGLTLDGSWVANTNYGDPRVKELLLKEAVELVEEYKDTKGLLLFLLGNENNYGLFWEGAETEDIPEEDKNASGKARALYKLFNEATVAMKAIDDSHPIAICNGDLLYLDVIKEECADIDIFGVNMYRGVSFGDAFTKVKEELELPILFTEFGGDAYNALEGVEDQKSQAYYMLGNWKEVYENAAGLGLANNSIGGFTFQFSDGWWKYGQTKNLEIHDDHASWANGGYSSDYKPGINNMNEEWFGICAKGKSDKESPYPLYPRAAYYVLEAVHRLNPYQPGMTLEALKKKYSKIKLEKAIKKATKNKG